MRFQRPQNTLTNVFKINTILMKFFKNMDDKNVDMDITESVIMIQSGEKRINVYI